jgi:hypothetical protein
VAAGRAAFASRIERARNELGLADPGLLVQSWDDAALPGDVDGVVLVGTDHDLAHLAARTSLPICLVPGGRSDVLRMFGLDGTDLGHRISHGNPYPADLGYASNGTRTIPFVAHLVASKTGRLPGITHRLRRVTIDREGRISHHQATGVAVINTQHVGGEAIAPRSALMDGAADLQVFGGSLRQRVTQRRRRRHGLHLSRSGVERRRITEMSLEPPRSWSVAVDGVAITGRRWEVRIEPGCWSLWV